MRYSADLGTLVRNRNNNRPGVPDVRGPEGNSSRHPPAMEKHLREMDHYRAFLVGQRDKNPGADEGMPQYIEEWERRWEQLSDGKNTKGSLRSIPLLWTVEDSSTDDTQRSRSFRSSGG